jgi:hypothetical protein
MRRSELPAKKLTVRRKEIVSEEHTASLEDRGSTIIRNVGVCLQDYTELQPARP